MSACRVHHRPEPDEWLEPQNRDTCLSLDSCQTLHDITRFCHEQAVREIFAFGAETQFPEFASKQLLLGCFIELAVVAGDPQLRRQLCDGVVQSGRIFADVHPVQVEADKAKAKYKRGVLSISLPKQEQAKRRRIEVSIN